MRRFRFYKDELNRWYVDLPEWEGDQAELEMVCGADTMLDILAQGDGEVRLTLSLEPIETFSVDYYMDSNMPSVLRVDMEPGMRS